jgi:hypothetical protein
MEDRNDLAESLMADTQPLQRAHCLEVFHQASGAELVQARRQAGSCSDQN